MRDEVPTLKFYVFIYLCLDAGTYCLVLCLFVRSFVCFKTLSEIQIIQHENFRMLNIMTMEGFVKKWPLSNLGSIPIFGVQEKKKPRT